MTPGQLWGRARPLDAAGANHHYRALIGGRKKNRVWAASEALAELDDLDRRIQAAMT